MDKSALLVLLFCFSGISLSAQAETIPPERYPFSMDSLIPWSIVAFDRLERGPAERIRMVKDLGFNRYAFGGRMQHIARLQEEIELAREEEIEVSAVWLYLNHNKDQPGGLKPESEMVFTALEEQGLSTQIWVGFHPEYVTGLSQMEAEERVTGMVGYLCERAKASGSRIALYNHGGWFGEPENQLRVIQALPQYKVGIIYNYHHGHDQLADYASFLPRIMPYLWCVSLNGMRAGGPKILTIGEGELERDMIVQLLRAGYRGPFAVLGHVKGGDPEVILARNVAGLHRLFPPGETILLAD